MDFGSPDRDQTHVRNSEPSIALVKSGGCDLISHSVNDRVTRGCLTTLDKDQMAKIKEEVGPRRGIMVHLLRATWQHRGCSSVLQQIGWLGYFAMNSSIN